MKICVGVKTFLFLLCLPMLGGNVQAQTDVRETLVQRLPVIMSQIRELDLTQPLDFSKYFNDEQIRQTDPLALVASLASYEKDQHVYVQYCIFEILRRTARLHSDKSTRQMVVPKLIKISLDSQSAARGMAATCLVKEFTGEDFSEDARKQVAQTFRASKNPDRGIILLCGLADLREFIPDLKKYLIDEKTLINVTTQPQESKIGIPWYATQSWYARLARARMGVREDIERCLVLIEMNKRDTFRFPSLLFDVDYIRQPESVKYLVSLLNMKEAKPVTTSQSARKRRSPDQLYASEAIYLLAKSIQHFPIEPREDFWKYTPQEIETARQWMTKQTRWEIIR
jgi:hypothetical protein